ncbi:MAG: LuxR C-terminal-related transcriptional regulator [Longimicrobiaceae bacterium]
MLPSIPAPDESARPTAAPLRVAVATDVCLYREGLAISLSRRPETDVVATAGHLAEALELLRHARPDVLLLDLGLAGSAEVVRAARELRPETKVVALAISDTEQGVLACAEAGVRGFVTRDASIDDLVGTMLEVARGELVCAPAIAASLFRHVGELAARRGDPADASALTPREREVLALVGEGLSNKEISRRLRIGLSTVKNHVHHLLEKLHVSRRGAAAARLRPEDRRAPSLPMV